jgi:hypothetical protein
MSESMGENKAKREAKERDGWECRFCGMSDEEHNEEYGRGLHAHHIVKANDGGIDHPRNLITVCRDCHNTLENTQADALSRIKEKHIEQTKKTYKRRIKALEADLREERNKTAQVFAWLENSSTEMHIILKGLIKPEVQTFTDREKAAEVYAESEGTTRLLSTTVNYTDDLQEAFRFVSTGDVSVRLNSCGDTYFEADGKQLGEEYMSRDIPEALEDEDPAREA